jgi:cytochrome P450
VVSRHAETLAVLRDHAAFSSEGGGGRSGGGTTLEDMPRGVGPGVMLNMLDPPLHTAIRALVNAGFKPRTLARLEGELRERTRRIFDAVLPRGRCDFLVEVAAELPLQTIAGLLGLPQADRHRMFEWTTALVDYADRDLGQSSERLREAAAGLAAYGRELIARRRAEPGEDMLSLVVHAEIPGEKGAPRRLAEAELLPFFMLLIVAGSETTPPAGPRRATSSSRASASAPATR